MNNYKADFLNTKVIHGVSVTLIAFSNNGESIDIVELFNDFEVVQ